MWRAHLRSSWRRVLVLVLLTAFGGGTCLAVAAGARRTSSAYSEVLDITQPGELGSSYVTEDPNDPAGAEEMLSSIPFIDSFSQVVGYLVILPELPVAGLVSLALYSDADEGKPLALVGTLPEAADDVFINETLADAADLSVGDQLDVLIANIDYSEFVPVTMRVVGIGMFADEVYEDETGRKAVMVYSRAFVDEHPGRAAWSSSTFTLKPGVSREDAIAQLAERGIVIDDDRSADRDRARHAIRPLVVTLWTLAILTAVATIVLVGQGLQRLLRRSASEQRAINAIGSTRTMLLAGDLAVASSIAVAGAICAVGVAIALSPFFPQGAARRIAALRGYDVDVPALAIGASILVLALCSVSSLLELRSARTAAARPGKTPRILDGSPAAGTGVRFATGRHGLVGTVGSAVVGLSTIVAGVVFIASLNGLVARPELSGFSWDLMGRESYSAIDYAAVVDTLEGATAIERVTGLTFVDTSVNGIPIPGSVWTALDGKPWPPIIEGRAPVAPNEMLVGPETLRALDVEIGDVVTVIVQDEVARETPIEMTVVGTAVSPPIGLAGTDTPRLNEGALFQSSDLEHVFLFGSNVLIDLTDPSDADEFKASFPDGLPDDSNLPTEWFTSAEPAEVTQADRGRGVLVLAMLALAIGVLAAIANNLVAFVRERRKAFAVLKAVGFTPGQIRATVLWQSGTVVALSLVASIPIGLIFGRWLYERFADGIGVIAATEFAIPAVVVVLIGAVVLVQATALLPASRARHTPASELRSE